MSNVNEGGYFGDQSKPNDAFSGYGTLTVGPFSNTTFNVQVARGFRDPTLSDRFFRGPSGRGFITGNPDLEPETSLQFDYGGRYTTSRCDVAAYGYRYEIKNLIERYPTGEPDSFAFRNRGRARREGFRSRSAGEPRRRILARVLGADRPRHGAGRRRREPRRHLAGHHRLRPAQGDHQRAPGVRARSPNYADDDRPGVSEIDAPGHFNLDFGASWAPSRITSRSAASSATR